MVNNIARDPFEIAGGNDDIKTTMQIGGALASPSTAYLYDWNLLPLGQQLWLRELETYKAFPPLQAPSSYNLDQVIQKLRDAKTGSHVGQ